MSSSPRPLESSNGRAELVSAPASALPEQLPSLNEFIEPLRRFWWVILLVLALAVTVGVLTTRSLPKEYAAEAMLIIGSEPPRFLGDEQSDVQLERGPRSRFEYAQYLETQFRVIVSEPVLGRVADGLGLVADDEFIELGKDEAPMSAEKRRIRAIEVLKGRARVVPVPETEMIGVVVWDRDAARAALIANTVVTEYIGYTKSRHRESMSGALDWLGEQSSQLGAEVEEAERALFEFRNTHGLLSTPFVDRRTTEAQRVEELGAELTEAEVRLITVSAQWEEATRLNSENNLLSAEYVVQDPTASALKARLIELEQRNAEISASLGPNHHLVKALTAELAYTRERLAEEVQELLAGLDAARRTAERSESKLRERLASQTRAAVQVSKLETEYDALQRNMENSRRISELVSERLKTMELASLLDTTNITLHQLARPDERPVRPILAVNVALAVVLGLILGLGAAFGLDQFNDTVRSERELEERLGLRVVGSIPLVRDKDRAEAKKRAKKGDRLGEADRYVARFPRSQVAEAFRGLRTNLLFMGPRAEFKTMLVTSAGVREGKTTVSTNLALSLASAGRRVCVVDTDLRRPRVHKVFDLPNDEGLTMVMIGAISLDDCLTSVAANLDILRCGPTPPNPSEQLASPAFNAVVAELRRRYDMVIFDSPPAALLSDASMLSQRVDGVLLVVRAESTHRGVLKRAVRNLQSVGSVILGVVVNGTAREGKNGYGYGYGYGYGRSEYTDEEDASEQPEQVSV